MKTKHTQGFLSRNIKPASKYPILFTGRNEHMFQVCTEGKSGEEIEVNLQRLMDCWNACEGIADPSVIPLILSLIYEARPYINNSEINNNFETRILNALARAEGK